ncbi:MarR family winged helix-turn-helix transcriptional regulator [Bdellovibrio bacteriovorus]|uniref:MarR family transcriptional regulator n=1 Tax=Bdellovibrio bacteriovorus str. Tiberius TaxID=1069642 RepID=K7YKQ1_BDEBC|nr:MarR family transcriptional regulator [Bdellovibrio bacteriovorus]AFY00321.1 MarR family transcriptional regulator [Bdellovibrio bacteriovorus str. Tiberius]
MAKLFLTEIPSREAIQEEAGVLYPQVNPEAWYSHILLRKITTEFEINLDKFFSQYSLSSGRFTLMILLNKYVDGLMPSELAQMVGVTQATISGLINSLEKSEIVQRTTHEKDGRSYVIKLTEKGKKQTGEILPEYQTRINKFWSEFPSQEKDQINGYFERLIKQMKEIGHKPAAE